MDFVEVGVVVENWGKKHFSLFLFLILFQRAFYVIILTENGKMMIFIETDCGVVCMYMTGVQKVQIEPQNGAFCQKLRF